MKKLVLSGAVALLSLTQAAKAQITHFIPGHLAVLRAGDGAVPLKLKQAPIFLEQFDENTLSATPSYSVRIPTNGPNSFFINGHAATEGTLTRSSDHKLLAFAGYGGVELLKMNGTASRLDIQRGFCTVNSVGAVHTLLYKSELLTAKINPRGVATDGTSNFWACGNASGTFYYNSSDPHGPVRFTSFQNSRAIKIIGNALYASMNTSDANLDNESAGIYGFLPVALPRLADTQTHLVVPAAPNYRKVVGFEINTNGDVAYMSDTEAGIQKYVKSGDTWKFAYNFSIPQTIPKDLNNSAGCFGLVLDFSGPAPVIFATTTEGYDNSVNSNRVVRIVDTNSTAVVTTLAQAGSTNIAFRGIELTPE